MKDYGGHGDMMQLITTLTGETAEVGYARDDGMCLYETYTTHADGSQTGCPENEEWEEGMPC